MKHTNKKRTHKFQHWQSHTSQYTHMLSIRRNTWHLRFYEYILETIRQTRFKSIWNIVHVTGVNVCGPRTPCRPAFANSPWTPCRPASVTSLVTHQCRYSSIPNLSVHLKLWLTSPTVFCDCCVLNSLTYYKIKVSWLQCQQRDTTAMGHTQTSGSSYLVL